MASAQFRLEQERMLAGLPGPVEPAAEPDPAPPPKIVVHVKGAVCCPGVYALPEGSRVIHAVEAAGGATADGDPHSLELAAPLVDGLTYLVYTRAQVAALGLALREAAPVPAGLPPRVNINTAGSGLLQTLPGIGPVKANAIIQYRRDHGPFTTVEELTRVSGIGAATLEKIADLITVR